MLCRILPAQAGVTRQRSNRASGEIYGGPEAIRGPTLSLPADDTSRRLVMKNWTNLIPLFLHSAQQRGNIGVELTCIRLRCANP